MIPTLGHKVDRLVWVQWVLNMAWDLDPDLVLDQGLEWVLRVVWDHKEWVHQAWALKEWGLQEWVLLE